MELPASQLAALRNPAKKKAGEAVDWIRIADARALTDLGLAERGQGGWAISPTGLARLEAIREKTESAEPASRDAANVVIDMTGRKSASGGFAAGEAGTE